MRSEEVDWTTPLVNITLTSLTDDQSASSKNDLSWATWTPTVVTESDITTELSLPTPSNTSKEAAVNLSVNSSNAVDAAYQRLTNLAVIIAVYSVVLVAMFVLACRRRQPGIDYQRTDDLIDLEVCGGGDDDDDVDDSAAFQRYWDTRRDLAERQRLLDSLRVENISSVTHGHLIDRLPQQAV